MTDLEITYSVAESPNRSPPPPPFLVQLIETTKPLPFTVSWLQSTGNLVVVFKFTLFQSLKYQYSMMREGIWIAVGLLKEPRFLKIKAFGLEDWPMSIIICKRHKSRCDSRSISIVQSPCIPDASSQNSHNHTIQTNLIISNHQS